MNVLSDMSGMTTHFVPFKPSPEMPFPPIYWGHIVTQNIGIVENPKLLYYFQSVSPSNMALLPLEVEAGTGLPILPSNCYCIHYPTVTSNY